jgi:hypothetical protein
MVGHLIWVLAARGFMNHIPTHGDIIKSTSQAKDFITLEARKNPGYSWSRDSSFPPKICGEIKIVLTEGWQRSALKFIEIFPNNIVILVATMKR